MARQVSCALCRTVGIVVMFVWMHLVVEGGRSAWGDTVTWYQGNDGRVYYTNVPTSPSPLRLAPPRPSGAVQRAGADGTLFTMHHLARQYNVDPNLIQAIIAVESNFNPRAVSPAGAIGLMQLMPQTAARYQVDNPFNPQANIEGGIRYLRDLFQLFPWDLRLVLAAYNAGEGAVQKYGGIPPYPETQRYVTRVMALYGNSLLPAPGKIYRYSTGNSILFTDIAR